MSQTARDMKNMAPPADGLWGLRAGGLLAFAAFMDPQVTGPEADAALRFKDRVRQALLTAGRDGRRITVNVVASTAGGTGAGMFLPFTLWLTDHPDVTNLETNLVLIASSAFDNEPLDSGVIKLEMLSKGRTGTFAIIRELDLLYEADVQTNFPFRRFPIPTGNLSDDLSYRLGSRPFHRVYWMGRRARDIEARKADVYRETDPLVRILSNTEAVNDLDGLTGTFPQRLLPSVVTVDYPRLARARRLSSHLAEAALRSLTEGEDRRVLGRRFFQYPGDNAGAFGSFLKNNEAKAFALGKGGETNIQRRDMDDLVTPFTNVPSYRLDYTGIDTGMQRTLAGYEAVDEDWQAYCASLAADLKQRWSQHQERIDQHVRTEIRTEGDRFRAFVTDVAAEYLNPEDDTRGPYPLSALRTQVNEFRTDVATIKTFFGRRGGIAGLLPQGATNDAKYQSSSGISQRIAEQESAMRRPREPQAPGGLTTGKWFLLLLVAIAAGVGAYLVVGQFPGSRGLLWLSAIGVSFGTAALMYWMLRRSRSTSLSELRLRQEQRLFALYRDRVFAHTGQSLLSAVNESFVPRAQEVVDDLGNRVDDLGEVYADLLANARARAAEVHTKPLHSVAEVGIDLSEPEVHTAEFLGALTKRVRIGPQAAEDARIRDLLFRIALDEEQSATGRVREMADDIRERKRQAQVRRLGAASSGGLDLSGIDAAIDRAATTALARHLPQTFEDALRREAGDGALATLDKHLAALVHKTPGGTAFQGQDRRRSSVDCVETDATVKRLYVPSVNVQGLVVNCVHDGRGGTLNQSVRNELAEYMGADRRPLVVPELGASIALLSIWVPDIGAHAWSPTSIMATHEGQRAYGSYYGAGPGAKAPGSFSAETRNFHILPELSAAAVIEAESNPLQPLLPCVVARLLGSHPREEGPTLLELFYLLRSVGVIREEVSSDRINRRSSWEIRWDGPSVPLIERPILAGIGGKDDGFGAGLRVVNAFDAFHEFMLLGGPFKSGLIREPWQVVEFSGNAALPLDRWARIDDAELAGMQRGLVERWWAVENRDAADRDYENMRELLGSDVSVMDHAAASEDWRRAVEFVLRSGHQRRRALAQAAR